MNIFIGAATIAKNTGNFILGKKVRSSLVMLRMLVDCPGHSGSMVEVGNSSVRLSRDWRRENTIVEDYISFNDSNLWMSEEEIINLILKEIYKASPIPIDEDLPVKVYYSGSDSVGALCFIELLKQTQIATLPIIPVCLDREMSLLAEVMSDRLFSLESPFSMVLQKPKERRYTIFEKVEMIYSHPLSPVTTSRAVNQYNVYRLREICKFMKVIKQYILNSSQHENDNSEQPQEETSEGFEEPGGQVHT